MGEEMEKIVLVTETSLHTVQFFAEIYVVSSKIGGYGGKKISLQKLHVFAQMRGNTKVKIDGFQSKTGFNFTSTLIYGDFSDVLSKQII